MTKTHFAYVDYLDEFEVFAAQHSCMYIMQWEPHNNDYAFKPQLWFLTCLALAYCVRVLDAALHVRRY